MITFTGADISLEMETQHLINPNSGIRKHDASSANFPTSENAAGLETSGDVLLWMGRAQQGRSGWVIPAHPSIPAPSEGGRVPVAAWLRAWNVPALSTCHAEGL